MRSKKVPHIHAALRQRVLAGEWAAGEKLPTEPELAESFGCSISTISKAMALLAHEGLVERKARAGTRVLGHPGLQAATPVPTDLDSFALIYPSNQHEGIWRTVQGFQSAAHKNDSRVIMLTTGTDYRKEAEYLGRLSEFRVKGAAFYANVLTPEDQAAVSQLLVSSRFPIVLTSVNLLGLGCPAVVADNFHAAYTMTRHLLAQGLKRVGYFSNRSSSVAMRDRHLGYRKAMEEAGIVPQTEWVFLTPVMNPDFDNPLREPAQLAKTYLEQVRAAGGVDGVVCAFDFLGAALIQVAREAGLRVPEDLKIVGIDDYSFAAKEELSLTTYHVPYEEIGERTFQLLEAFVAGKASAATEVQVRGHPVIRRSG